MPMTIPSPSLPRRLPLVFLFFSLLLVGCAKDPRDIERIIQERITERTNRLTANVRQECQKEILDIAAQRADSLLIARAQAMSRVAGRPPRPVRPGEPPVRQLREPLPLRPLFPFEIRFDTLLRDSLYADSLRTDSLLRQTLSPEQ